MTIDIGKIWKIARPILTVLTDVLLVGRGKGWWTQKPTIPGTGPRR